MSTVAAAERTTFTTSRLLDFFSEKELTAQVGHSSAQWPLVILKELADNALDHCEEAGVEPEIWIKAGAAGITVTDNGHGIPPETVEGILDYSVRVSSREAYVAPDRGAQGNALKTILAMPFVLDGNAGRVTVTARGIRHDITVRVDPIRQEPLIDHERSPADVKTGTQVTVHWPESASSILEEARSEIFQLADDYVWLNPHLTLSLSWQGKPESWVPGTNPAWNKWKPDNPTSPHWYRPEHLERLIAAYVTHPGHATMSVREFVTGFRGLTGTAKGSQVLAETGMTRRNLASLADGKLDSAAIAGLLDAMQRYSKPVRPEQLGVIGRDHLAACFEGTGSEAESFAYRRSCGESGGIPWVVEAAFAWCPGRGRRRLVTGVNWSPGIVNPFRRLGRYGDSLDGLLERQRVDQDCGLVLHLACPRVSYLDRGKSGVEVPGGNLPEVITAAVEAVTKKWAAQRKAEERHASAQLQRRQVMTRIKPPSIREAAFDVMEQAYLKASGNGRFFANARQVMYAARPLVLEITGGECWSQSSYFTQDLLPEYIDAHGLDGVWKIAYDARGHLVEPHRSRLSGAATSVALGTLEVRKYQTAPPGDPLMLHHVPDDFPTAGPRHRYSAAVFIEKEGFDQQIAESGLADSYDVAFMSTKGMSNTASRELVDHLASHGVRILIVRDFDRAGFTIAGTLTTSSFRYRFRSEVDVTDLGLRLADVDAYSLASEPWREKVTADKAVSTLRRHGATSDEIRYLIEGGDWKFSWGKRVELNAFTSEQFIGWLEAKLTEHGVTKVIPKLAVLELQYRRALARHAVNKKIDEVSAQVRGSADRATIPADLAERVQAALAGDPATSWDSAVAEIAGHHSGEEIDSE